MSSLGEKKSKTFFVFSIALTATLGVAAYKITSLLYENSTFPIVITITSLCLIFLFPDIKIKSFKLPSYVWGPFLGAIAVYYLPLVFVIPNFETLSKNDVVTSIMENITVPILILSLAYLSISLDQSGFFNWASFRIIRLAKGNGKILLLYLFLGVTFITYVTSNDIVILAMTPILLYVGKNARIHNMTPYLITQFIAANTSSMGLYIGNPTNIIIGNTVGLDFLNYAKRMLIPSIVSSVTALIILLVIFNHLGRRNLSSEHYSIPKDAYKQEWNRHMSIKVLLFVLCLIALALFGNPWTLQNIFSVTDTAVLRKMVSNVIVLISVLFALLALVFDTIMNLFNDAGTVWSEFKGRISRMPFEIIIFFFSFVVIVEGLEHGKVIDFAANGVISAFSSGPILGAIITGFYGVFTVNIMNNIPATIVFTKIWDLLSFNTWEAAPVIKEIFVDTALYASNFGANLTFIGALAGLMWFRILRDNQTEYSKLPTKTEFLFYGIIITPIVTVITCFTIAWINLINI